MKIAFEYIESEHNEMLAKKSDVGMLEFNSWFDASGIKRRLKKYYIKLQGLRCCYCQKINFTCNNRFWDLEHILSEVDYPQFFSEPANLSVCCSRCNTAKSHENVLIGNLEDGDGVPKSSAQYSIVHPLIDEWSDHLSHTHYLLYHPKTEKGKELIKVCKLLDEAAELAGQDSDAVELALEIGFYEALPNDVPDIDKNYAAKIIVASVSVVDFLRAAPVLSKLDREMGNLEKARERKWANGNKFKIP